MPSYKPSDIPDTAYTKLVCFPFTSRCVFISEKYPDKVSSNILLFNLFCLKFFRYSVNV